MNGDISRILTALKNLENKNKERKPSLIMKTKKELPDKNISCFTKLTLSKRKRSWKNNGKVGATDFVFTSKPMQLTLR